MPKLFEFLGIIIRFYSKEHKPIHVHAKYKETETRVSIYTKDGVVIRTTYSPIAGKRMLPASKLKQLKKLIELEKENIVKMWIAYFVMNERFKAKKINNKDF